jgi:hypothetical protein
VDLSGAISFNGWSNTFTRGSGGLPADGWEVLSADVSPVNVTQYFDKKALQDGMDANDVYENARTVSLIIGVWGSTSARYWDNVQTVLAAFNPVLAFNADTANLGFLPLKFVQPSVNTAWAGAGIPMQFYARPSSLPRYSVSKTATASGAHGLSGEVTVSLVCRDPRKYLQSATTYRISASFLSNLTYRGDYNSYPIVTFSLSATGASNATIQLQSNNVPTISIAVIDLSGVSSGTYVLDVGAGTFETSGGTNKMDKITNLSLVPINSDSDNLSVLHDDGIDYTLANKPSVVYREAWA